MDDQRLLEKLKEKAEETKAPDSLSPEQMEKRLKEYPMRKRRRLPIRRLGLGTAAVLCLLLLWNVGRTGSLEETVKVQQKSPESGEMPGYESHREGGSEEDGNLTEMEESEGNGKWDSGKEEGAKDRDLTKDEGSETGKNSAEVQAESGNLPGVEGQAAQHARMISTAETDGQGEAVSVEEDSYAVNAGGMSASTSLEASGNGAGDKIQTDGGFLYRLCADGRIRILRLQDMEEVTSLSVGGEQEKAEEIYVKGDRMLVVTVGMPEDLTEGGEGFETAEKSYVTIYLYDISDVEHPSLHGSIMGEGNYWVSWAKWDYFYMICRRTATIEERSDELQKIGGSIILLEKDGTQTEESAGGTAPPIRFPMTNGIQDYLEISSICLTDGNLQTDVENYMDVEGEGHMFAGEDHFYLTMTKDLENGEETQITKYSYQDGIVKREGQAEVSGGVDDDAFLDEEQGFFRVITNSREGMEANLYILDEEMKLCGKRKDLAAGTLVTAAVYVGDQVYFSTSQGEGGLSAMDLSDPEHPREMTEQKRMSGYSMLRQYGETLLLAIKAAGEEENLELSLSMFDISGQGETKEDQVTLRDVGEVPFLENSKGLMTDGERKLIGFAVQERYYVFSYGEDRFVEELAWELEEGIDADDVRGFASGERFYVTAGELVWAFDMEHGFEAVESGTEPEKIH